MSRVTNQTSNCQQIYISSEDELIVVSDDFSRYPVDAQVQKNPFFFLSNVS